MPALMSAVGAADDGVAHGEAEGSEDVSLFAVRVVQESDVCRAVGVVLDGGHLRGHVILVALEIYDTVFGLVPAAALTHGDAAVVVAARRVTYGHEQGLFGAGLVTSSKEETVLNLVPGVIGLNLLTAMFHSP